MKKGILLINLGTPDSDKTSDVRKYLNEFLTDGRVIDIPWLPRQLLVRAIITPFRAPKSAATYREIWDKEKGSPLKYYTVSLTEKLQKELPDVHVEMAMRYKNPTIKSALKNLYNNHVEDLTILPLFPQYASASTGSVFEKVMDEIKGYFYFPKLNIIPHFFDHPAFINAFLENIQKVDYQAYDKVLFSYHGLPESQLKKADNFQNCCIKENCCSQPGNRLHYCYRAQCFATTEIFVQKLGLEEGKYVTSFQSRLGRDEWIKPYTVDVIKSLPVEGVKKLLVISPSFVADCLETIYEITTELKEDFIHAGGEQLDYIESLNDLDHWVKAVKEITIG